MDSYTIDTTGPWRLYLDAIPHDWVILGTIRRKGEHSIGVLARSAIGVYVQFNAGATHSLNQRAVRAALHHATQAGAIHRA